MLTNKISLTMKISIYKILGAVLFLLWTFTPLQAFVKDQDFAKVIERSFDINADGKVELNNKYGNMTIKTWTKNKVDIRITIEVSANSEKVAEKLFEKVSIEFDNTRDLVRAITAFEGNGISWGSGNKITINYLVNMPETCFLQATNKYGHVDLESLSGDVDLDIAYGSLQAESISGHTNLQFNYSKGYLSKLNTLNAEIKYSELRIGMSSSATLESKYSQLNIQEIGRLEIESKYGEFTIGKIKQLVNEGKYDRFKIDSLGDLNMESSYTDITVGRLTNNLTVELKYGNVFLENIMSGFDKISILSQYADIHIGIAEGANLNLNFSGAYSDVKLPKSFFSTSDIKDESIKRKINGYLGSTNGGTVNISMAYGNFKLK